MTGSQCSSKYCSPLLVDSSAMFVLQLSAVRMRTIFTKINRKEEFGLRQIRVYWLLDHSCNDREVQTVQLFLDQIRIELQYLWELKLPDKRTFNRMETKHCTLVNVVSIINLEVQEHRSYFHNWHSKIQI